MKHYNDQILQWLIDYVPSPVPHYVPTEADLIERERIEELSADEHLNWCIQDLEEQLYDGSQLSRCDAGNPEKAAEICARLAELRKL